jgi:hypothetical protein
MRIAEHLYLGCSADDGLDSYDIHDPSLGL